MTFLISPELTEEELIIFQGKVVSILEQAGAVFIDKTRPVRKQLPLPIKKTAQAFLLSINCSLEPDSLQTLKQKLSERPELLRYSVLAKTPQTLSQKMPREKSFTLKKKTSRKVEISQIEKKLEEILGE